MREALDRQLQEKAARDGALKQHESNCFPCNHTASFQPADSLRVWSSHYATQHITAREEARVCAHACACELVAKRWRCCRPSRSV